MSAADFKKLSEKPEHQPPAGKRGAAGDADELRERAFWSSVTNSPPIYGADTPVSLFDERVPWGWNLRRLGDWLQSGEYEVPDIPGGCMSGGTMSARVELGCPAAAAAAVIREHGDEPALEPTTRASLPLPLPCPSHAGVTSPMTYFGM